MNAAEKGLSYYQLRATACGYIFLPVLIFLLGFVNFVYGLLGSLCGAAAYFYTRKGRCAAASDDDGKTTSRKEIGIVFAIAMLWSYIGGMNGYFYQTMDWNCRNPIFFDLIQFEWPVIYENGGWALSYYIGHWLPPAALAKPIYWLTGSMEWARFAGRMFLWIWSSLGLTICMLLIGAATPGIEIGRQFYKVFQAGTVYLEDMTIGSFVTMDEPPLNFGCTVPEKTFFFRHMAK